MEKLLTTREFPKTEYELDGLTLKETQFFKGKTTSRQYMLQPVTYNELVELRLSRQPGLVLKCHEKLFYTKIPAETRFTAPTMGEHLCGICANVCRQCKKVNAWTVQFYCRNGLSFKTGVIRSGRIEKYPFIPFAIETFNCKTDVYLVLQCNNFKSR